MAVSAGVALILRAMKELLDAFWRAAAYCLHPKVIGLSLLPVILGAGAAFALGYFYWEAAVGAVRAVLESWQLVDAGLKWVESYAGASFRSVLAPLIVVALAAPVVVVVSVLLVALLMTPAIVNLVAARRFPQLQRRQGGGIVGSLFWSLGCALVALVALVASLPLWLIPPLVLVLPPLIWGWLTFQVMSYDVLAEHASREERRVLLRRHRLALLGIGVVSGYLGAAPSLIWALSAMTLVFAPLLIAVSMWLYTVVFAFSALWFAHYALAALDALRREDAAALAVKPAPPAAEVIPWQATGTDGKPAPVELLPPATPPGPPPAAPV